MSEERKPEVRHRRRSRAEIEEMIRVFASSGLSPREFCRRHDFPLSTLGRNLPLSAIGKSWPSAVEPTATPVLVEVEVKGATGMDQRGTRGSLRVLLSSGQRIEVEEDFDPGTLQRLVRALENR